MTRRRLETLALLALLVLPLGCGGGGGAAPGAPDPGPQPDPVERLACEDALVPAPGFFEALPEVPWAGAIELGQTHVIREDETRLAPHVVAERAALLLFTPEAPVAAGSDVRVGAFEAGVLLGALRMRDPASLPPPLEQDLTSVPLAPYSEAAWNVALPWSWVREGVVLRIARLDGERLQVREHTLRDLGAPHRITVSRVKIVLFGDEEHDTRTEPASRIARDFFASIPVAELRWVDHLPWVLDHVVVRTPDGPRRVVSEAERRAIASDADHWSILKHQVALRASLANTGRGLALTREWEGDSSPYGFGTSVAMGWYVDPEGIYRDIDDAPWAAGWTGWTAMWLGECGNVFIHEVGHSFSLLHFTSGTAAGWGIDAEYPQDGVNLETHPWGYDTTRHRLRTWYRVGAAGPVEGGGGYVGKRDPMNGGEAPDATTCFPPFTAYHAMRIQAWAEAAPTIAFVEGVPGIWRWDAARPAYEPSSASEPFQSPIAVDVPVVTLVGTLGDTDAACQTYPAIHAASGNVFDLPDPFAPSLPAAFDGARHYLALTYLDGSSEQALIARGQIEDTGLYLYSLNLDARRQPVRVDLYRSPTGYPAIDAGGATWLHSQAILPPTTPLPAVVTVGRGRLANDTLELGTPCEPGVNCGKRRVESTWREAAAMLRFEDGAGQTPAPDLCLPEGSHTTLRVPVRDALGRYETLVVHAQRVLRAGGLERAVALNDETAWLAGPDLMQALRLWVPFADNRTLPAGRYVGDGPFVLDGVLDGVQVSETPLVVDLEVLERTPVDLATEYVGPGLTTPDSSMYFLVRDPAVGPTARVWWGSGGATRLRVPVLDGVTGALTTLEVDALQEACGARWDLHAGRVAGNCEHKVVLSVDPAANPHLVSGRSYRTPDSEPLVVDGRRWHAPDATLLIGTFAFEITYTAP